MAKFYNKHIKYRTNQRSYYGDSDEKHIYYDGITFIISDHYNIPQVDTISGVLQTQITNHVTDWTIHGPINDTNIAIDEVWSSYKISTMVSGFGDHGSLSGLDDDDHLQYVPRDGSRGFTSTVSGVDPTEDYHLTTRFYVDGKIDTVVTSISGVTIIGNEYVIDHGLLTGLADDDHLQYVPRDGSRGFTSTVSGIDPVEDYHLTTKVYVDDSISSIITSISGITVTSGGEYIIDHGLLEGLDDDDHTMYVPTDGSRGFTSTVSGVDPIEDYHLVTKGHLEGYIGGIVDIRTGRESLVLNDSSKAVTFSGSPFSDTNYTISVILNNTIDAIPSIYPMIVSAKATTGFTVTFAGDMDSNNYELEWLARHD